MMSDEFKKALILTTTSLVPNYALHLHSKKIYRCAYWVHRIV